MLAERLVSVLNGGGWQRYLAVVEGLEIDHDAAEIAAAALGLETLREPCHVHLFTDSRYVVETMSGRFRRKANLDWWLRLDKAASRHQVEWEWTKGHDGHVIQEAVDRAARRIATLGRVDEDVLRDAEERVATIEVTDAASLLT